MRESYSDAYAMAGVDITAGYQAVELMKKHIAKTMIPGAGAVGDFGALFELDLSGMEHPCLVSGTDGVGTKIRIAQLMGRPDTVGIDCVAMCVNDIVCSGARPLFFLDYIAIGKNEPDLVAAIVSGIAEGCVQAGCALIGGETAEHPGLMQPGDYDIAGFSVGIVEREAVLNGSAVRPGDTLIGLPSSGLHSNGYSLVRRVFDVENADLSTTIGVLGRSLGEELLEPTTIYVRPVLRAISTGGVHACAHITGGGIVENLPRCLPEGLEAQVDRSAWNVPPIFTLLREKGGISEHDMYNTFNMGLGMVLVCDPKRTEAVLEALQQEGIQGFPVGRVVRKEGTWSITPA